jgi:hypothetical protein
MTIKRIFRTCAVAMVAAVSAGGVWSAGAGTALAPEPAQLTTSLYGTPGSMTATADAKYVHTNTSTKVVMWPSNYPIAAKSWAPAGQPCYPGNLPAGQQTTKAIRVSGAYAICN